MNQKAMREVFHQQLNQEIVVPDKVIQLIGFLIDKERFAIPILNVQEIIKPIEYTRVPLTPHYVLGVFNLRGSILPLIDLGQKFGLKAKNFCKKTRILVMTHQNQMLGFAIDDLIGAFYLKEEEIDYSLTQKESDIIYGIGRQDNQLTTILKVEELFKRDF